MNSENFILTGKVRRAKGTEANNTERSCANMWLTRFRCDNKKKKILVATKDIKLSTPMSKKGFIHKLSD